MAICLAANDGDRAAWEAWVWPALQPDADLDALSDSGGQRYQSLDAKLSLALSRVITQAGDQARHVATKLRMRTQANARRGTFVMGREILAMILNHFRTPGDHGHVRRGQVIQYGKGRSFPSGKEHIKHMEESGTDVPDDDDFLVEWDEWSEVDNGRGPMADWNHNNVCDAEQGKVVASAPPVITEKCGFSFKPPKANGEVSQHLL